MTVRNAPNGMQVCVNGRWVCARCHCQVETTGDRIHWDEPRCECPPEGEDPYAADRQIEAMLLKFALVVILAMLTSTLIGCADMAIVKSVVFDGARNGNGGFSNKAIEGHYCPRQVSPNVIKYVPCEGGER